jgi:hypothetical protein
MSDTTAARVERALSVIEIDRRHKVGPRFVAESLYVARYFDKYYAPAGEGARRVPGLRDAGLPPTMAEDIRHIVGLVEVARSAEYARLSDFPVGEVRVVIDDLKTFLRWLAVDEPPFAATVRRLFRTHAKARTLDDLVLSLSDHLRAVRSREEALRPLPAFDPAVFEKGDALLAAHAALRVGPDAVSRDRDAALRTLLRRNVDRVVAAAALVFRRRPDLAREVYSQRRRRAMSRTGNARTAAIEPGTTPTEPTT